MAKAKTVIMVNDGVCTIWFKGDRYLPGAEIELTEAELENKGIESLVFRGDLVVKDDSSATREIKERIKARAKKDPDEGKSRKKLEDGGEF